MADTILEDMDAYLEEYGFSTRTEFIREAIRDKLQSLEHERFEQEMRKFFRENKADFVRKQWLSNNSNVFQELEKRFGS
jgi:Arc/MetJ-type ribon-helix-helix transcriptional regulator